MENRQISWGSDKGQEREHTQTHIPFVMARLKGVFARPAVTWAAQKRQSIQEEALHFPSMGWQQLRYYEPEQQRDQQTSFQRKTLSSPIGIAHQPNSAEEGRAEWLCPTVQIHWVQLSQKVDPWSCLPLQTPLLITVDQLPKQRKKLEMGMAEK